MPLYEPPPFDPDWVVYEDTQFVVVNKPEGLLSVPGRTTDKADCAVRRVATQFPKSRGPLSVHRLDMATSGLLVVALSPKAQRALSMLFQERQVRKKYVAVLEQPIPAAWGGSGLVSLPIAKDWSNRPLQRVSFEDGREALTRWRRVLGDGGARVELFPHTGRSHQLRVHCAHGLANPIRGDRLYGDPRSAPRLMLHAAALRFANPRNGETLELESPAPF